MNAWPRHHRLLFGVTVACLVLLVGVYLAAIRPLARKVHQDRNHIAGVRSNLDKSGWPLDPERLASLLEMKRVELEGTGRGGESAREASGMRARCRALLRESTSMFTGRIARYFEHSADFVRDISRLDYQDEYNNLYQNLAARGVFLSDEVLGLGEGTTSPHNYQLLLQVWTVDRLAELALASGLRFQQVADAVVTDERGVGRRPAQIRVLPVRTYNLGSGDPYLLEFPIQAGLTGTPEQFFRFLASLNDGEGTFLPVSRMQISALPGFRDDQQETAMGILALAIDVECSSFFQPGDDAPERALRRPEAIRLPPRGF